MNTFFDTSSSAPDWVWLVLRQLFIEPARLGENRLTLVAGQVSNGASHGGLDYVYVGHLIGAIVLPLIGIAVVILSVLAFFLPFGLAIKDSTQKVRAFGVDLEVSVVALFVLIGVVLSLSGIYLITRDYEQRLQEASVLRVKLDSAEREYRDVLDRAKRLNITAVITLQGNDRDNPIRPDELNCKLRLFNRDQPLQVREGYDKGQYRVAIDDISREVPIKKLECHSSLTKGKWEVSNFSPLEPVYELQRQP